MAKVSIIIPSYNSEKFISNCLDSIFSQTHDDLEVILVDDCSTDHSYDVMRSYEKREPRRLKLVRNQENKGAGASRNVGLDIAEGKYIGFVDSDDYLELNAVKQMHDSLEKTGVDIARINRKIVYRGHDVSFLGRKLDVREDGIIIPKQETSYLTSDTPGVTNKIFRKELIGDKRFPEDLKWEDYPFSIPLMYKANGVVTAKNTHYNYNLNFAGTTVGDAAKVSPKLLDIFGNTNIVCGFNESLSWLIPVIKGDNEKRNNLIRLKVLTEYYKIQDTSLQTIFKEYIIKYSDDINLDTITNICDVLTRLSTSNSAEMFNFRKELAHQILSTENPIESLNKVERVFIKNNIPTVGKTYSCFEILHPNFKGFDMTSNTISPVLKTSSNKKKQYIIFNDLLKASFGSNNRAIKNYLLSVDKGYKLYTKVKEEDISFDSLTAEEQELLKQFRRIINTLYDHTLKGRNLNDGNIYTNDVIADLKLLENKLAEKPDVEYNLADRVVRMFCGGTEINSMEKAQRYIFEKDRIS